MLAADAALADSIDKTPPAPGFCSHGAYPGAYLALDNVD